MNNPRPDADTLLAQLRADEARAARGRLRIYFGASAGVGKTYAMLATAHRLREEEPQAELLVGVVETHGRDDTAAMLEGLPLLPLRQADHRGRLRPEFDLDGALQRKPRLILVDELAHSNAAGSRHPKRWQDVQELLAAGIDVWTTLNVQHLESLNDVVGSITGVRVRETLPDSFFDSADEVVVVDTPADELLARLAAGKVYANAQAERAAQHFFRKGNLMALRELSLRRAADRVEDDVQHWRRQSGVDRVWKTEAGLLCAIGPGAAAEAVLRSAARLSRQLGVSWHAVHVETPRLRALGHAQREATLRSLRLAAELGATTAVLPARGLAGALVAYAREHNLSQLLLGRAPTPPAWQRWLGRAGLHDALSALAPDVDLIEIGAPAHAARPDPAAQAPAEALHWAGYLKAAGACLATAALCAPLAMVFELSNIVMLFLLAVVVVALRWGRGPSVLASFLGVGLFDFFFVTPRLSFAVSDVQYLLTFAVLLGVGLVVGQLTAHLRYQAAVAGAGEARSRALFELTRELGAALQREQVVEIAEEQLRRELQCPVAVLALDGHDRLPATAGPDGATARWALDHGRAAGLSTDTLPGSPWFYLPLQGTMRARGVLAIRPADRAPLLQPEQRAQLETCARLIGQALERVHYVDVARDALVHIESERLRNSLLSALSHDLRTPLAVVCGMADTLATLPALPADGRELADSLSREAQRINAMVNKLLDMARLQSGAVELRLEWQPVDEVVGSALQAMQPVLGGLRVRTDLPPGLPLVRFDAVLIERVLCNLLENAAKYAPPGSTVEIAARAAAGQLHLSVSDDGPGLPPGREDALFDKFARAKSESNQPGVGLGLAICRAIMQAHGGAIAASNLEPHGARFTLTLPLGEPPAMPDDDES